MWSRGELPHGILNWKVSLQGLCCACDKITTWWRCHRDNLMGRYFTFSSKLKGSKRAHSRILRNVVCFGTGWEILSYG